MFVECHQLNLYHGRASTIPLTGRAEELLLVLVPTYEQSEDRESFGQPSARIQHPLDRVSRRHCDTRRNRKMQEVNYDFAVYDVSPVFSFDNFFVKL
ncbi:hypothetical protein ALC62_07971 [Cyphomyrmex costatus]|uniref:Uncharacterized protein n=1 Tax=Cyphomyrmex costatus TaxID=456900 RepID=A0A195CLJ4_9HYME|nr:hypothetical protein ALC62_07971 [Cyphomyrmex costatus]